MDVDAYIYLHQNRTTGDNIDSIYMCFSVLLGLKPFNIEILIANHYKRSYSWYEMICRWAVTWADVEPTPWRIVMYIRHRPVKTHYKCK